MHLRLLKMFAFPRETLLYLANRLHLPGTVHSLTKVLKYNDYYQSIHMISITSFTLAQKREGNAKLLKANAKYLFTIAMAP